MEISELKYSRPLKMVVARVNLRKNFTGSKIAHIVIAKQFEMPDDIATGILDGSLIIWEISMVRT